MTEPFYWASLFKRRALTVTPKKLQLSMQRQEEEYTMRKRSIPVLVITATAALLATSCATPTEASGRPPESTRLSSTFTKFFGPRVVTIPAGTVLRVRTDTALSTVSNENGDRFEGTLFAPIAQDGRTLLPVGTPVEGLVVSSGKGGRV